MGGMIGFKGLLYPGNIDLFNRPVVKNADGSVSTIRSMSFDLDGKQVLVPTVSDDVRIMGEDEAIKAFMATGRHLGIFDTPYAATEYAKGLSRLQRQMLEKGLLNGNR